MKLFWIKNILKCPEKYFRIVTLTKRFLYILYQKRGFLVFPDSFRGAFERYFPFQKKINPFSRSPRACAGTLRELWIQSSFKGSIVKS